MAVKTKEITPHQYASYRGYKGVQLIHRWLKEGRTDMLTDVIEVKKYSRFYTLLVPHDLTEDSFTTLKPRKKQKAA